MATIKYLLQSKKDPAPIYLRLTEGRKFDFKRKTGLSINPTDWSKAKGKPKQTEAELKNLSTDLDELKAEITKKLNEANSNGVEITGDWLQHKIDLHFDRTNEQNISEYVTDCIKNILENADTRINAKKEMGISESRKNSYKSLSRIFKEYEASTKKRYKVKDINIPFANSFLKWLVKTKHYSQNYALKKISDLKTVCNDAELSGIKTHPQLKKVGVAKGKTELPVFLTPKELKAIEKADIKRVSLQNVRKWLLLGCNIGQRGGDLLKITENNFVTHNNGLEVIELKQKKTGKNVTIPVLETTKKILETGLPYKISIQKFNDGIKEVCRLAGIDEPKQGTKICMVDPKTGKEIPKDKNGKYIKKGVKRKIESTYPKYELTSSHTCRRTFATNQYGVLPTPLIMRITAHGTEKMFLKYIGKDALDYAQQIADFYELQALKKKNEPQLQVVKNASGE